MWERVRNRIMYGLLWITIFWSLVWRFADDFHSWLRHYKLIIGKSSHSWPKTYRILLILVFDLGNLWHNNSPTRPTGWARGMKIRSSCLPAHTWPDRPDISINSLAVEVKGWILSGSRVLGGKWKSTRRMSISFYILVLINLTLPAHSVYVT